MSYKKGYKRTPEQIENWKKSYRERIERLGYRYTEEQKKKISDTCKAKGIRPPKNLGRKHDEETKKKMSENRKGNNNLIGYKQTEEHRKKRIDAISGSNNYKWSGGIKNRDVHSLFEPRYKEWRTKVFERDHWKCKISNINCKGRLEAHHILTWKDYPELRYEINNGITLCHAHHPRKRDEVAKLSPFFMELVAPSDKNF